MNVKDSIKYSCMLARQVTNAYLGDLEDKDLLLRPVPGMNHIAWQLGHLIRSEHGMITSLGTNVPELPAGFAETHDAANAQGNDPKMFARKAEYLELFERVRAATLAALDRTSEADFDKPGPESMRSYCPTVGALFNLIPLHEMMHTGQWVAVRRMLGKPIAM